MQLSNREKSFIETYEYITGYPFYIEFSEGTPDNFETLVKMNFSYIRRDINEKISTMEEEAESILGERINTCPFA